MSQLQALLLTLGLEVPLVLFLATALRWNVDPRRLFVVACTTSLLTHPFAWSGLPALAPHLDWWPRVLLVEGGVGLVEAMLYRALVPLPWQRALSAGLLANAFSFGIGLLVFSWLAR